jgi:MFS family permease
VTVRAASALLHERSFQWLMLIGSLLGLVTISDSLLYLGLQDQVGFDFGFFPLLYVATAAVYMVLAVPAGRLSDAIGRRIVFLLGYAFLAVTYVFVLLPQFGLVQVVIALLCFGTYYAMTDGVLAALGSALVPQDLRGSGLGLLASATSVARLVSSVLFGLVWTLVGIQAAVVVFLVGLILAALFSAVVVRRNAMAEQLV